MMLGCPTLKGEFVALKLASVKASVFERFPIWLKKHVKLTSFQINQKF